MRNNNVFISVGRPVTEAQEQFVSELETFLRASGLNPRAVGRSDFSSEHPLKFIQQLLNECVGTVIIAFERVRVIEGLERRGSTEEARISNQILPTVWNQIEAAMAYVLGQPLLVIVEDGARNEGLLEGGYDWFVQRVTISREAIHSKQFTGVFADWKRRVEKNSENPKKVDVEKITIKELLGSLKPAQIWAILASLIGVLSGAIALGHAMK